PRRAQTAGLESHRGVRLASPSSLVRRDSRESASAFRDLHRGLGHRDPEDDGLEGELASRETLRLEAGAPRGERLSLRDEHQLVADRQHPPEADLIRAAEREDTGRTERLRVVHGAELRGRFKHEHPGEDRPAGHVTSHPELIGMELPHPDDDALFGIEVRDAVELLELEALRIEASDLVLREDDAAGVDRGEVEE